GGNFVANTLNVALEPNGTTWSCGWQIMCGLCGFRVWHAQRARRRTMLTPHTSRICTCLMRYLVFICCVLAFAPDRHTPKRQGSRRIFALFSPFLTPSVKL